MKQDINTVRVLVARHDHVRQFELTVLLSFSQDPLNGPKEISFFCASEASVNVAELDSALQVCRHVDATTDCFP